MYATCTALTGLPLDPDEPPPFTLRVTVGDVAVTLPRRGVVLRVAVKSGARPGSPGENARMTPNPTPGAHTDADARTDADAEARTDPFVRILGFENLPGGPPPTGAIVD